MVSPQLMFYLGPKSSGKTYLALKKLAISPRTLIVSAHGLDILDMYEEAFYRESDPEALPLFKPSSMRLLRPQACWKEIFSRRFNVIFFQSLPSCIDASSNPRGLAVPLAKLAVWAKANIIVRLNLPLPETISTFEANLSRAFLYSQEKVTFWMPSPHERVRFLRFSGKGFLRPEDYIGSSFYF